jgi:hypothetical protein
MDDETIVVAKSKVQRVTSICCGGEGKESLAKPTASSDGPMTTVARC